MEIACIGDLHLISAQDPHRSLYERRAFFTAGYDSLRRLINQVNIRKPDLVVFLGDIVDWVSDENVAFAVDFLRQVQIPWQAVPGNHDLAEPLGGLDTVQTIMDRCHKRYWWNHGIDMGDRYVDAGDFGMVMLDNSLSNVVPDSAAWLGQQLERKPFNLVCQHVPLDIPQNRAHIHAIAPTRHLDKYTCSGNPGLYASHYRGRVQAICNGHVHIGGRTQIDECVHHMCPLALTLTDPNRNEPTRASATFMTFANGQFHAEVMVVE